MVKTDINDDMHSISIRSLLNCPIFSSFVNSSLFGVPLAKGLVMGLTWRGKAIVLIVCIIIIIV